jgi:hypothetical protein
VVAHIPEYYDYNSVGKFLDQIGVHQGRSGRRHLHDDPGITMNMFITDPQSVRWDARVKAGKATINGVSDRRQGEDARDREEDRRHARDQHGGGDQEGDREPR